MLFRSCHGLCGRPPPPFRPPAQAAPASAVAELGVVRRLHPHPVNESQTIRRPRPSVFEVLIISFIFFFIGIRVTTVLILVVLAALYIAFPLHQRRSLLIAVFAAAFASVLVPVDISLGQSTDRHYGSASQGPRFLICAPSCMPNHEGLLRKYGEYVSHTWMGGIAPTQWVFVWD